MPTTSTAFDELKAALEADGIEACLARLVEQLAEAKKHQEWFEARKMQVRQKLGLSLLSNEFPPSASAEERRQLEDRLIDEYRVVYREVGLTMFRHGELRQGWMLLHAAGEEELARRELAAMDVGDENRDEYIEVALHQGLAPELGFAQVLRNYGTCNSITTYEQTMHGRPLAVRQAAAAMLVDHIHQDLLATVNADITRQEGAEPKGGTLRELVAERDWLFGEGSYHIDTTHLASVVRFARVLDDEPHLRRAIDLTDYGRRLSKSFQYEGEEPFKDIYPSHALWFYAALGEKVDEAVEYFRERAQASDVPQEGTLAVETYIALLDRLRRHAKAAEATVDLIPAGVYTQGIAPTLFELCEKSGDFTTLVSACQQRDDLLGYAAGLIQGSLLRK